MSLLTDVERARHEGRATAAAATGPIDRAPEEHVVIDPSILHLGTPVLLISATSADGCANLALISSSWLLGTVGVPGNDTRSPARGRAGC